VIAYQLINKQRFDRRVTGQLRQMAAEALGRIGDEDLRAALVGMGEERIHELRRVRGGMKEVYA
jgi:HEAT repeat protein